MFSSNSSLLFIGALCAIVGAASDVLAQNAPEPVKAKVGAPELGQAKLIFSPDPKNIALDDCSTPAKGLNQYVITSVMPTSIVLANGSAELANGVSSSASWTLSGDVALLPWETSTSSTWSGSWVIRPQHIVPNVPVGSTASGFKFDVYAAPLYASDASVTGNTGWTFPSSNDAFGEKTFTHTVNGTDHPVPVALFFPSGGFQHPTGGPRRVDGSVEGATDGVPNYIYYYDKAWQNPFGIEVRFQDIEGSSYTPGDSFVQIGSDGHGVSGSIGPHTYLFAKEPTTGKLVFAGFQVIRGLDNYARIVYHESVHMRLWDAIFDGAEDADLDAAGIPTGDGLPDSIENQIGTSLFTNNSVPWNPPYYEISDEETFCRMCERDLPVPDDDWTSDGFNFGRPASPNRCERVREYIDPHFTKEGLIWIDARSLVP